MPLLKENDFKKHIKAGNFSNLYVICGEEKLLVKHYTKLLVKGIMGDNPPQFNFHTFDSELLLGELSVAVAVAPFVSEYNCVLISDYDVRTLKKDDFDEFMTMLKNIPDTSIVIYSLPTLVYDEKKSGNISKVIKLAEKSGVAVSFERQGSIQLERTLVKWAENCGAELSQINADKIVNICGKDLNLLKNEIAKLSAFAYETQTKEITLEMIENMVTKNLEARVFDIIDDIIYQKSDEALKKLDVLFYQREEPIAIIAALSLSYIDMYRVRVCLESGGQLASLKNDFPTYKSREWVLKKTAQKISRIPTDALCQSIDELLKADILFKSSNINKRVELEKLVAKLILLCGA